MTAAGLDVADLGRVHIVGIGGAGMSGIARILMARGVPVTGSDAKDSRRISALRALGARIWIGHDRSFVAEADTVVFSTAINDSNPELSEAREKRLRIMTRALALAVITADYRCVAVAGTHGKTTTTSMLTVALQHCGVDPSFVIGSELNETGSNAHLGSGETFVVEADESDGSFLQLAPVVGIVTNIEADHLNYWQTLEALQGAFVEFVSGIGQRDGFAVICADDPGGAALADTCRAGGVDVRTYGESELADFRIEVLATGWPGWTFDLLDHGVRSGPITLKVPGHHNVLNAAGALACGIALGQSKHDLMQGLASFTGTRRRLEFRGQADGIRVYDDYAHHPTAVTVTLRAARETVGEGRLIVACQPYRYYRTAALMDEYGVALALADAVVVLEVFAPGEEPIPGAGGQAVAAHVQLPSDRVLFEPSWSRAAEQLAQWAQPGDVIATVGEGDVSMLGPAVLDLLAKRAKTDRPIPNRALG